MKRTIPQRSRSRARPFAAIAAIAALISAAPAGAADPAEAPATTEPAVELRPVAWIYPKSESWSETIQASGNIMPWQEIRIGSEVGGLRLASVAVSAGDRVKKGQVLAHLDTAIVETEVEAAQAQLAEAEANLAQAVATLDRGRRLAPSGGVSQQELTLYDTQKRTAEARLNAARAHHKRQQLRLQYATIVAPDDGIISAVSALEGTMIETGSDLFRLIRRGRLEWRAEVRDESLLKLANGQDVVVKNPLGNEVHGRVRQISPTIDLTTRHGLVYVDLPGDTGLRAGLHVSGSITTSRKKVLVIPAGAIVTTRGQEQVMCVGKDSTVAAVSVQTGRNRDGKIEILAGLDERSRIVIRDQASLTPGDAVKVAESPDQ